MYTITIQKKYYRNGYYVGSFQEVTPPLSLRTMQHKAHDLGIDTARPITEPRHIHRCRWNGPHQTETMISIEPFSLKSYAPTPQ